MSSWKAKAVVVITAFLLGCVVSYFPIKAYFQAKSCAQTTEVVRVVIKRDTLRLNPILREIHKVTHDTIKIVLNDTIVRRDTIYLEREQRVYSDEDYTAFVSGISPRLDSIFVYPKTIYETRFATQDEWRRITFGLQVGVGGVIPLSSSSVPSLGAYIGVGLGFRF